MIITADLVLPVSAEPIEHGAVAIKGERIEAIGSQPAILAAYPGRRVFGFGRAMIMPGMVNVHAHLEYTALGPIAGPEPFLPWIQRLVASSSRMGREDWLASAKRGARLLLQAGVTCVGDVVTFGPGLEAALAAGLRGISFVEAVGMRGPDSTEQIAALRERLDEAEALVQGHSLRVGLSPHSVYTISSRALAELGRLAVERGLPLAMHLAETVGEVQLVQTGEGELAESLRRIGGHDLISSRGRSISPIEHARRCGLLHQKTVAVHAVHTSEADLLLLADSGAGVALCPSSNHFLQVGEAPALPLWRQGIGIGIGTDSLASNDALDLFREMRLLWTQWHRQSTGDNSDTSPFARDLVQWITLDGARVLGLDGEAGSLDPGKYADLAVVKLDTLAIDDPYYYLVTKAIADDVICTVVGGTVVHSRPRDGIENEDTVSLHPN